MTGSTSEGIRVLTRRVDRSIRDSGKGVTPDPRTTRNFNKPFGFHPGTQSIRSSARSPGPRRTTTFGETETEDRRQEPSSPSDIEMEVPTEKEGPKPRTGIATPANRRPKAGPKLFRDRPSGRSTDPAKVDLRKRELTQIPKLDIEGETTTPQKASTLARRLKATDLVRVQSTTDRARDSAENTHSRRDLRGIEGLTSFSSFTLTGRGDNAFSQVFNKTDTVTPLRPRISHGV